MPMKSQWKTCIVPNTVPKGKLDFQMLHFAHWFREVYQDDHHQ